MKKFVPLSLVAAVLLSTQAIAQEATTASAPKVEEQKEASSFSMSGNAALTSNYLWRGISYTKGYGVGQAGVDFSNIGSVEGLYFGLWGSGIQEGSEIDLYGGYSTNITEELSIDVGYIHYHYTLGKDTTYDPIGGAFSGGSYGEFYVAVGYSDYGISAYYEDDLAGLTSIADATFGPVDIQGGYYLSMDTTVSDFYFGSVGVNWPCLLDNSYTMTATVAYNSGATQTILNSGFVNGSSFALTLSKEF